MSALVRGSTIWQDSFAGILRKFIANYPTKNDKEMVVPPERTPVEYVGRMAKLDVNIYVYGDELDPAAVTDILGLAPRFACQKGGIPTRLRPERR